MNRSTQVLILAVTRLHRVLVQKTRKRARTCARGYVHNHVINWTAFLIFEWKIRVWEGALSEPRSFQLIRRRWIYFRENLCLSIMSISCGDGDRSWSFYFVRQYKASISPLLTSSKWERCFYFCLGRVSRKISQFPIVSWTRSRWEVNLRPNDWNGDLWLTFGNLCVINIRQMVKEILSNI